MPRRTFLATLALSATLASPCVASPPCGTVVVPSGNGVEAVAQPIASMHPVLTDGSLYDQEVIWQIFRPLLWFAGDHSLDFANSEADAITVSPDQTRFHITLKSWRWSDGEPITADDVVYGFELMKSAGQTFYGFGSGGMPQLFASVTADSPLSLTVTTTRPVNPEWFEGLGLGQLYALPRHAWGHVALEAQRSLQTSVKFLGVDSGPFALDEYQPGRYVALRPNPYWTGHKPQTRRLVIDFLAGIDPLAALQTGELDVATIPFATYGFATSLPGYRQVPLPPGSSNNTIIYNFASSTAAIFKDVRVRQAIADALDMKALVNVVFHGQAEPLYSPIEPALEPFLSPAAKADRFPVGYDPGRALELLAAAGYSRGPDGVMQRGGDRLEWTDLLSSNSGDRLLLTQFLQADLARIGIRMNIRLMDFNQIIETMTRHPQDWQTASIGWSQFTYPDMQINFGTNAGENYGKFSYPEVDALATKIGTEPGRQAIFQLQDLISAQQPFLFMPQGDYSLLAVPGITGFREAFQPNYMWKLEYLALSGSRACPAAVPAATATAAPAPHAG